MQLRVGFSTHTKDPPQFCGGPFSHVLFFLEELGSDDALRVLDEQDDQPDDEPERDDGYPEEEVVEHVPGIGGEVLGLELGVLEYRVDEPHEGRAPEHQTEDPELHLVPLLALIPDDGADYGGENGGEQCHPGALPSAPGGEGLLRRPLFDGGADAEHREPYDRHEHGHRHADRRHFM